MGLFVDTNHLPVSYELFQRTPGDIPLLTPVFKKAREDYGVERVIVVVDNGVNSAHHLYRIAAGGNGYIVSQSIRSAEKEIKDYVLNPEGYVPLGLSLIHISCHVNTNLDSLVNCAGFD